MTTADWIEIGLYCLGSMIIVGVGTYLLARYADHLERKHGEDTDRFPD